MIPIERKRVFSRPNIDRKIETLSVGDFTIGVSFCA